MKVLLSSLNGNMPLLRSACSKVGRGGGRGSEMELIASRLTCLGFRAIWKPARRMGRKKDTFLLQAFLSVGKRRREGKGKRGSCPFFSPPPPPPPLLPHRKPNTQVTFVGTSSPATLTHRTNLIPHGYLPSYLLSRVGRSDTFYLTQINQNFVSTV